VIDATLLQYPAPLLSGAHDAIVALHERYSLAIISDTGFASGTAQNRLLAQDGLSHLTAKLHPLRTDAPPTPRCALPASGASGC